MFDEADKSIGDVDLTERSFHFDAVGEGLGTVPLVEGGFRTLQPFFERGRFECFERGH